MSEFKFSNIKYEKVDYRYTPTIDQQLIVKDEKKPVDEKDVTKVKFFKTFFSKPKVEKIKQTPLTSKPRKIKNKNTTSSNKMKKTVITLVILIAVIVACVIVVIKTLQKL